ncbi:5-dehydro-4-deoxyglucarate dehydratase [Actinorugispora endophytica]|uniref:Probable 5-dehydro-4-deoxyglucarate dehydratase n=1 Tax=Actinorugispora endophytica TaxID=1605990 RepID=A0A4R6UHJ0_9ACTN|nr:5-dehydro-4-deoxyglucarate dehydratase [Actinorugispora endophytica]TDQ45496.1 5-dehydro-4-deoxyglucarate dehydratase [Actinorugispora endophytica]
MDFDGILFFPLTPFDERGAVNEAELERHIGSGLEHGAGGVFAACGTGEIHALSADEHARVVARAVGVTGKRVPVVAGAGGSVGTAIEQAAAARDLGADGILLLPPYLVGAPQRGLVEYVRTVAEAVDIPVIVYQRGTMVFTPDSAAALAGIPSVVGFKDGAGDLGLMRQIVLAVRERRGPDFTFFNGLPTAELTFDAYRGVGVPLYSSAAFAFAPEVASAFYTAAHAGDPLAETLVKVFYDPLVKLRDRSAGYAVSLVKAGARLRGADMGGVRAPFVEPTEAEVAELGAIIDAGLAAIKEG